MPVARAEIWIGFGAEALPLLDKRKRLRVDRAGHDSLHESCWNEQRALLIYFGPLAPREQARATISLRPLGRWPGNLGRGDDVAGRLILVYEDEADFLKEAIET